MSSMIGIKVADGAFFPVLTEGTAARKRLVLTTAHDAQTSVQIDFYRASSMSMHSASYIGTLLIENIQKKNKGSPSIELIVSLDDSGEFSASAYDSDHPEEKNHHVLTASLSAEDDLDNFYDIDFDREDALLKDMDFNTAANVKVSKPKLSKPAIIIVSALILLLLVAAGLWFLVFRSRPEGEAVVALTEVPAVEAVVKPPPQSPPVLRAESPPPRQSGPEREPPLITAPPATAEAPAPRKRPPAPVSSYKVPSVIPAGGVSYRLRWGDTLWDVSQAFYRTPWRYRYLANYNGIRNPDHIIAGRTIRIPPLPK